jgi:hypothetical protein
MFMRSGSPPTLWCDLIVTDGPPANDTLRRPRLNSASLATNLATHGRLRDAKAFERDARRRINLAPSPAQVTAMLAFHPHQDTTEGLALHQIAHSLGRLG